MGEDVPVRSTRDQHIHVHLPRQCCEHIGVSSRHDLLSMHNADTY